ncbi:MAG: molybdenum cofactor guanylyltransferase [Armatimonas sp.]
MTIAVLAGGESRRFGQDKAALFLPRVLSACESLDLPILVVGRPVPSESIPGVTFVADDFPGQGPLGGLITALRHTDSPVLALACDLAFLETEAPRWLPGQWEQHTNKDLPLISMQSLADIEGEVTYEPLFSVYPQSSLNYAEDLLTSGRRSMHGLLKHQRHQEALLPEHLLPQLRNVNTPEDLE